MRLPTPTLLVFTLGAEAERAHRRLLPRRLQGTERGFRRSCLEAVLEAGRGAGCRLEICSPRRRTSFPADVGYRRQSTGDFGTRLEAAFTQTLADWASGGPVMVVGTDTPDLSAGQLARARDLLADREQRVILGPCPDGGIYLLAANRPIPGLSSRVRWCHRETLADLLRLLAAAGREVVLLEGLLDLDRPADLHRWLGRSRRRLAALSPRWQMTVRLLRRVLAEEARPPVAPADFRLLSPFHSAASGRAPPHRLTV